MDDKIIKIPASEVEVISEIELYKQETEIKETVKEINTESPKEILIGVTEVTGLASGIGVSAEHEHEISQIRNLDRTLKTLGAPHEHYSQNGGYAEFREWTSDSDSNYVKYNIINGGEIGYFVSLVDSNNTRTTGGNICIDICDGSKMDAYGVIVGNSAFCGYQYPNYNLLGEYKTDPEDKSDSNNPYAKVCLLGEVMVRVHSSTDMDEIMVGGYVVPDSYGCAIAAQNTGFKVIAKGGATGVGNNLYNYGYVIISLVPQSDSVSRIIDELESAKLDLNNISISIGKLQDDMDNITNVTIPNINDVVDDLQDEAIKTEEQWDKAQAALDTAKGVAENAQAAIEGMHTNYVSAVSKADNAAAQATEALGNVAKMKEDLNALYTWENGDEKGIQGFVNEMGRFGTLQQEIDEHQSHIDSITQTIGKDGAAIQLLVARADLYSVGEHSPSNGLSYSEAKGILDEGDFVYVCIDVNGNTETSHIYNCNKKVDISAGTNGYFTIDGTWYSFEAPYALSNGDTYEYNARTKKLLINKGKAQEVECKVTETNATNGPSLVFESEYEITFEPYGVYKWTRNSDTNEYWWVETNNMPISWSQSIPNEDSAEYILWYCENGIRDNDKYIYLPGTLYLWDDSRWVSVATINDSNARSVALINQTAESLTSTITNVQGDVSNIEQKVGEISTTVSENEGALSSISQTADKILAGVYDGVGSSSLELLLSGMRSVATKQGHVKAGRFQGSGPEALNGAKYTTTPIWDETKSAFVFSGEPSVDGVYYIDSENSVYYYKDIDNGYEIYTMGNQVMASLNTRVTDTESEIESWTRFKSDVSETLTSIKQENTEDASEIVSMVFGEYRERTDIVLELPDGFSVTGTRYSMPPTSIIENDEKIFKYADDVKPDEDGIYYIPSDSANKYYYKLLLDSNGIIGYEKYELRSSKYTSIMQKIDDTTGESSIGLAVGNDDKIGSLFVNAINDKSEVLITADKIGINGTAVFRDNLADGTTTISGNYIRTGVLTSNNYSGPITYVMYGTTIDVENSTIIKGAQFSDCIYYSPIVEGTLSSLVEHNVYYYADKIEINAQLSSTKQRMSQYIVSTGDFDFIPSDIELQGMKIDLNNGTIYSKNLMFDRGGNLSITGKVTAKSGYIGDGTHGFTIDHRGDYIYTVGEDGLAAGVYDFYVEDYYYTFELSEDLSENDTVTLDIYRDTLKVIKSGVYAIVNFVKSDVYPKNKMLIPTTSNNYYYMANDQVSYDGSKLSDNVGKGDPGVYIGPDGIGLGNGGFWVKNTGDLSIGHGKFKVDSRGNLSSWGSVDLAGDIDMRGKMEIKGDIIFTESGKITWSAINSPCQVLYASAPKGKPVFGENYFGDEFSGDHSSNEEVWHRVFQEEYDEDRNLPPDYYASYTYDGGITWTDPVKIKGEDGMTELDLEAMMRETYGITSTVVGESFIETPELKSPVIDGGVIKGSYIKGGVFYSTGVGANDDESAYYIYHGDIKSNNLKGYLRYDTSGLNLDKTIISGDGDVIINGVLYPAGTEINLYDAKERVFFATEPSVALKIHSGDNMSLCAGTIKDENNGIGDGTIYFMSNVHFAGGVSGNISGGSSGDGGGGGPVYAVFG